jgi:nitroreductase
MKMKLFIVFCFALLIVVCVAVAYAQKAKSIRLLPPRLDNAKPLMQSLKERKSGREFSSQELPLAVLSDILWAANGINRPDSGRRTAPSAINMQEIDIYAAKADGLYLFDAKENALNLIIAQDLRALTGRQPFAADAPVNLIYVADLSKMSKLSEEDRNFYSATDTGFISENVYLYCAGAGLVTVVRGAVDRPALAKAMGLRTDQKIILAQTVGYPKQ